MTDILLCLLYGAATKKVTNREKPIVTGNLVSAKSKKLVQCLSVGREIRFLCLTVAHEVVVMKLHRSDLDLRHGPPAYESHILPGILSCSQNSEYYTVFMKG